MWPRINNQKTLNPLPVYKGIQTKTSNSDFAPSEFKKSVVSADQGLILSFGKSNLNEKCHNFDTDSLYQVTIQNSRLKVTHPNVIAQ